jgi:hypothetical protein
MIAELDAHSAQILKRRFRMEGKSSGVSGQLMTDIFQGFNH